MNNIESMAVKHLIRSRLIEAQSCATLYGAFAVKISVDFKRSECHSKHFRCFWRKWFLVDLKGPSQIVSTSLNASAQRSMEKPSKYEDAVIAFIIMNDKFSFFEAFICSAAIITGYAINFPWTRIVSGSRISGVEVMFLCPVVVCRAVSVQLNTYFHGQAIGTTDDDAIGNTASVTRKISHSRIHASACNAQSDSFNYFQYDAVQ